MCDTLTHLSRPHEPLWKIPQPDKKKRVLLRFSSRSLLGNFLVKPPSVLSW